MIIRRVCSYTCFLRPRILSCLVCENEAMARVWAPGIGLSLEFWVGNHDYSSCFLVYVMSQTTYFVVS